MKAETAEALTEAIYDAAIAPAEWGRVMAMLKQEFRTEAETLYGLDLARDKLHPIHIDGIDNVFLRTFEECFYTDDNPCIRSEPLHRPGVVRTDSMLLAYFNDPQVLRRSIYYNEWMRPQRMEHTMGATPLAEGNTIVNLSLLRNPAFGPFSNHEVRTFGQFAGHLQRALRLGVRLGTLQSLQHTSLALLDAHPAAVLLLDGNGSVMFANRAATALVEAADGVNLGPHGPMLARRIDHDRLARLIARALAGGSGGAMSALRPSGKRPYSIIVSPLSPGRAEMLAPHAAACVMIADPETAPSVPAERLRALFHLTPAEVTLAERLLAGDELRAAAETLGISYATARAHLISIFRKTSTRRQGELMKLLMSVVSLPDFEAQATAALDRA